MRIHPRPGRIKSARRSRYPLRDFYLKPARNILKTTWLSILWYKIADRMLQCRPGRRQGFNPARGSAHPALPVIIFMRT